MTRPSTALATSPPVTAPSGVALLREVPSAPRGRVARDRLVRRLIATGGARLVLVRAPAGYGKTALLEAWAAADPRRFHWLMPGRGPLRRSRWTTELVALAAQPARLTPPFVLVVDGWDEAVGAVSDDALAQIAASIPDGSLLVMATRGAAPLRVGRLRAEQDVLELGASDLAMTHSEAAALVADRGVELAPDALDAILRRTEGWPAALSLAASVLAAAPDPDRAAASFSGRDPFVAEYVRDELLSGVSEDRLRFLLRTSVLETLEASVCDAVLAARGSAVTLHALSRSALPMTHVDRDESRLRCHPLLRETLLAELRRREPEEEAKVRLRASRWFEHEDKPDAAVAQALAAGDLDRVGELLWRLAPTYAWDARRAILRQWLAAVPTVDAERNPALALSAAMSELAAGRFDVARHWAALAEDVLGDAPRSQRRSLRAGAGAVDGMQSPHDPPADVPCAAATWALRRLTTGTAALLAGDRPGATAALEDGIQRAAIAAPGVAALCHAELALGALCAREWEDGAGLAERARSTARAIGPDDHASMALVVAVSAFARAHRGRFEEARADVRDARRLLAALSGAPAWYEAQALLALGRAELRLSEAAVGRDLLAQAARLARKVPAAPALRDWIAGARKAPAPGGADPLTAAELRVLRLLPSHLSFREIGGRLNVSSNTIKSQAHAIYRKLGASSRSAAVRRGRSLGLLDDNEPLTV